MGLGGEAMYLAHKRDDEEIQLLSEHSNNVALISSKFAEPFNAEELAGCIGLLHDIGKYSSGFQHRILNNGPKVDHSTAGAVEIKKLLSNILFTYPILGHHSGLLDGGSTVDKGGTPSAYGRLKKEDSLKGNHDYSVFSSEISLTIPKEPPLKFFDNDGCGFSLSFLIRMLFSCLVDADYLDTEDFMLKSNVNRGKYESIDILYKKLQNYTSEFKTSQKPINVKRNEILNNCISKSTFGKGLYTLTVPTGGGKTISSLAFALSHAKYHNMERVIYVIPYTSIIEQNAKVFSEILGEENVLEHHSNISYDDDHNELMSMKRLSSENWDAPVIVTTNVQFFESLFAARTSKCRKLHNIANAVIIFDEAQMIPLPYLQPCVNAIAELVYNFNSTAVLCSATQPALDRFFPKEVRPIEICDSPEDLYEFFKRTQICHIGKLTDEELAEDLNQLEQVLCIVSTRKQAQNLYDMLDSNDTFHLSTLMYPNHRKEILDEIRRRLNEKQPCKVISTSLVEAGVDLDFPVVYRSKAGLDSIIQAAGRCNREGNNPVEKSIVYVFSPDDSYFVPLSQRQPESVFDIIERKYKDLSSLEAIKAYFEKLYQIKGDSLDQKQIIKQFNAGMDNNLSFPFKSVAGQFNLIENQTYTVLIPITPEAERFAERLRYGERTKTIFRQINPYCVSIYKYHYEELRELGILDVLDTEIAVLADTNHYSSITGLTLTPKGGNGIIV